MRGLERATLSENDGRTAVRAEVQARRELVHQLEATPRVCELCHTGVASTSVTGRRVYVTCRCCELAWRRATPLARLGMINQAVK